MSITQFIDAANEMEKVFNRAVWTADLDMLPKIERIAEFAYQDLTTYLRVQPREVKL